MSVPLKVIFTQSNTQDIVIRGLKDTGTGLYLNSATVSATLINSAGNIDPNISSLALLYVANTNGNYTGRVPSTFDAALGTGYTLKLDASQGAAVMHMEIPVQVLPRTA